MPESFDRTLQELANPVFAQHAWHPVFVHGLVLAALVIAACLVLRQRGALVFALLLAAGLALSVMPFLAARESAVPALQAAQTKYDATRLSAIGDRLAGNLWVYQGLAAACGISAAAVLTKRKIAPFCATLSALATLGLGIWGLDGYTRSAALHLPGIGQSKTVLPARAVEEKPAGAEPPEPPVP